VNRCSFFLIYTLMFFSYGNTLAYDATTGTVSSNLDVHIPSINYENQNIWVDFKYAGISVEKKQIWELRNYGINPEEKYSLAELDYTIRTSCAYLWLYNPRIYDMSVRDNASYVEVFLVKDSGEKIQSLHFNDSITASRTREINYDKQLLLNNIDQNLLIECKYKGNSYNETEQMFRLFVPLKAREAWKKNYNESNDLLFEVFFLSDIFTKIYFENYQLYNNQASAIEATKKYMDQTFPGSYYNEINEYHLFKKDKNLLQDPNEIQGQYYLSLQDIAYQATGGNVELLNKIIAQQYSNFQIIDNNKCIDILVCSAFFNVKNFTKNSDFSNELSEWKYEESNNSSSNGGVTTKITSSTPLKHSVSLSLNTNHSAEEQVAQREFYQDHIVNSTDDVDSLVVLIDNNHLDGGCNIAIACFSSGLAGYYACFLGSLDEQLGCILLVDYNDTFDLGLGILVESLFEITSNADIKYIPVSGKKKFMTINLSEELNFLAISNQKYKIKKIRYGAFVGEISNKGECKKCYSTLEVNSISLKDTSKYEK